MLLWFWRSFCLYCVMKQWNPELPPCQDSGCILCHMSCDHHDQKAERGVLLPHFKHRSQSELSANLESYIMNEIRVTFEVSVKYGMIFWTFVINGFSISSITNVRLCEVIGLIFNLFNIFITWIQGLLLHTFSHLGYTAEPIYFYMIGKNACHNQVSAWYFLLSLQGFDQMLR